MNICRSLFEDYGRLYCYSILSSFFSPSPSSWGLPILYSPLKAIMVLHLLIIWILT